MISFSYFLIRICGSKFTLTEVSFVTFIIRLANFRVDIVSSNWLRSGQMFASIIVLLFPPIESFRRFVNLLYRYGMWSRYFSDNATTTCSRNESDLLMNCASSSVFPSDPVFFVRSDPAKSTRFSLLIITFSADSTRDRISKWIVNTQCDLVEVLLSLCSEMVRLVSPSKSWDIASSSVRQRLICSPFTWTYPVGSSWMARFDSEFPSRSYIISL